MRGYLFPFELVEQDSRIVIYGFGKVGCDYLSQLKKTNYCEILYFVDRNYAALQNETHCRVVSAEVLYAEPADNYDSVLVAVDGRGTLNNIKAMLMENGISSEKIITPDEPRLLADEYIGGPECADGRDLLEDESALQEYASERYEQVTGLRRHSAERYFPELSAMIASAADKTQIMEALKKRIAKIPAQPYKLILLQLMYIKECFDAGCFKMFVDTVAALDGEPAAQFAFFVDMDIMQFNFPGIIYDAYFTDRRRIMQAIAEKIAYRPGGAGSVSKKGAFRVAITCYLYKYLKGKGNLTSIVRENALLLRQAGADVSIFSMNSILEDDPKSVFMERIWSMPLGPHAEDKEVREAGVEIRQFYQKDPYDRMREFTGAIMDYAPEVVLDMSDNLCPPVYLLHQHFPVIHTPVRLGGTSSFFDTYLTQSREASLKRDEVYHSIPRESIVEIRSCALPARQERVEYRREDYGLREEDFVLVTVSYRLGTEISEELARAAAEMLTREPDMKWILVGRGIGERLSEYSQLIAEKQIIIWGCEDNLESFYQMCDVYLQPNRIGGGMSVRQAMREGIPVAMLDFQGDARMWMTDSDVVHGDYRELMACIERMHHDRAFYMERSARMRQILDECYCENEGERLLAICKAAAEKYGPMKRGGEQAAALQAER